MSWESLVPRLIARDPQAWDEFHLRYQQRLLASIARKFGCPEPLGDGPPHCPCTERAYHLVVERWKTNFAFTPSGRGQDPLYSYAWKAIYRQARKCYDEFQTEYEKMARDMVRLLDALDADTPDAEGRLRLVARRYLPESEWPALDVFYRDYQDLRRDRASLIEALRLRMRLPISLDALESPDEWLANQTTLDFAEGSGEAAAFTDTLEQLATQHLTPDQFVRHARLFNYSVQLSEIVHGAALSADEELVIILHFALGFSYQDTARLARLHSQAAAESNGFRAKKKLQAWIIAHPEAEANRLTLKQFGLDVNSDER
jgi:DNA-directed RNA polymerase specialized sigma24 family protein